MKNPYRIKIIAVVNDEERTLVLEAEDRKDLVFYFDEDNRYSLELDEEFSLIDEEEGTLPF